MTKSRLEILLMRAKERGLTPISIWDLHPLQQELLEPPLDSPFHKKEREILKKYGYTKKVWGEIVSRASSFWWCPDQNMEDCNKEIKALCYRYDVRSTAWTKNHLYQLATQAMRPKKRKKQHITRTKNDKGTYLYDYQ